MKRSRFTLALVAAFSCGFVMLAGCGVTDGGGGGAIYRIIPDPVLIDGMSLDAAIAAIDSALPDSKSR